MNNEEKPYIDDNELEESKASSDNNGKNKSWLKSLLEIGNIRTIIQTIFIIAAFILTFAWTRYATVQEITFIYNITTNPLYGEVVLDPEKGSVSIFPPRYFNPSSAQGLNVSFLCNNWNATGTIK